MVDLMHRTEIELVADDSTKLIVRRFTPAANESSRTILVVHGLCEHGQRYDHVARKLVEYDWNVIVPDLRGHGCSGGVNTHVSKFHRYARDLDMIHTHFELSPECTAILAHSMGGLVSLRYLQLFPNSVAALAMISPLLAVKVPIPKTTIATGKLMSLVAPRTRFRSRVDPVNTTRNKEALARRTVDPLIRKSVTAGWFFAMRAALARAWDEADQIQLPLLVMQAGEDHIVDADAPAEWLKRAGSDDISMHVFPEHYHELLNEPDWPQITESIVEWAETRVIRDILAERACLA